MTATLRSLHRAVREWSNNQTKVQRKAFRVGGHQHHGGRRWRSLDASTIEDKGHTRPLVETGRLRQSSRSFVRTNTVVLVTNRHRLAPFHHYGTRHIPRRRIIHVTRRDISDLKARIVRAIQR